MALTVVNQFITRSDAILKFNSVLLLLVQSISDPLEDSAYSIRFLGPATLPRSMTNEAILQPISGNDMALCFERKSFLDCMNYQQYVDRQFGLRLTLLGLLYIMLHAAYQVSSIVKDLFLISSAMSFDPIRHLLMRPVLAEISREREDFAHKYLLHALGSLGFSLAFCNGIGTC